MPDIVLKSVRRKTLVSRNRVRKVMAELFGKSDKSPVKKKGSAKASGKRVTTKG
jgi:hypothetical protein